MSCITTLSPALVSYARVHGAASAASLPEHQPVDQYVREQLRRLVAGVPDLDPHDTSQLLKAWSAGFQQGVRQRVNAMKDHSAGWRWPDPVEDNSDIADDERAAAHQPVSGTLHLPRKGGVK